VITKKLADGAVTTAKVDPNSLPFLATLRTGQTLRGSFTVGGGPGTNVADVQQGYSFQFPLVNAPTAPQANVIDLVANPGASTANCPGVSGGNQQTPNAANGQLCVYITGKTHIGVAPQILNVSRLGFGLEADGDGTLNDFVATGFWAVTAP
jgi:hypothetical protein